MGTLSIPCASRRQRHRGEGERASVPCGTVALFLLSGFTRWWRGVRALLHWGKVLFCAPKENQKSTRFARRWRGGRARLRGVKFSFACQKRTRKAPAISTRWIHEKGAARPFQTPKGKSKPKNASRFAKRIFWASPVYGSADGVTLSQNFMFSKGVKSAAKQQNGGELKCG